MSILEFLALVPEDLKQKLKDGIVNFIADQAEKVPGGEKTARAIRKLSSQAPFHKAFDKAMANALNRFVEEYTIQDEDLVQAITSDGDFWKSGEVRQALMTMIQRPGSWVVNERESVVEHFRDVLPKRINRVRVDKAATFLLRCVVEELWTLPGVEEIRGIYSLQFQKIGAEAARQQVTLLEAQLRATTQLSADVRQALLELATTLEQRLLASAPLQPTLPAKRPYHNLPQPDYRRFVGRSTEMEWLRQRLSATDRAWLMVLAGIGGVGKSALAQAIAHDFLERYSELQSEERFDAIIWISAKEEILTTKGREDFALSGSIFRTLEDMYTTIAQTLEREDITRAILKEQNHLVRKALSAQRTLLIVDNLESVTDSSVRTFLRNLPAPTKCIITSREWLDVAAILKLNGLALEEAEKMINEEAIIRNVNLDQMQRQRLFERTSGLPLPIKLSIARMASGETFDQVTRWLGDATGDLPEYCVKGQIDVARQRKPDAWKLLLTCSLFNQDANASREALGYIANLALADRDEGLALLQRLSLLNCTETDRFWMLPLVQGYAGTELLTEDFGEELTERWLDWLLKITQQNGVDLDIHIEKTQVIDPEYPNLLWAIRWCHEHKQWEILLQLAEGTWFYPYIIGSFGEAREILEAGVKAAQALKDEQREGHFLRLLARLLFRVHEQDTTALAKCLEKAEQIARRYHDETELGMLGYTSSITLFQQGDLERAERVAKTMLEIGERLNNLQMKVLAAQRLSTFESKKQQYDEALQWLDQGDEWCRKLNWSRGFAWNMNLRGTVLIQQGNIINAEQFLTESLKMSTTWSEHHLIAINKYGLTQVYAHTERLQLATQMAKEAHDMLERLGMTVELAEVEELLQKLPALDVPYARTMVMPSER